MSLERLQGNLIASSAADQPGSGPPLAETLDWLKGKLPLAANHYVVQLRNSLASAMGETKDVTLRTVPIRFDSCTIIFAETEVDVWEKFPKNPTTETTHATRFLSASYPT